MSELGPEDPSLIRNAMSTERLRALVARLENADLHRALGGGWTVAYALAHLAFWDVRQHIALQSYARGEGFPAEDKAVNDTLETVAPMLSAEATGHEAVRGAELVDATVARLSEAQRESLVAEGLAWAVERWRHREDHIAQIEAVLP